MNNMNILITSAGQRVSLVRAFQTELKREFQYGKVYTVDMTPNLAPACIISDGYKEVKRVTDLNYIEDLIAICIDWQIKLIVPTIDTELLILSQNKDKFNNLGIKIVVSDEKFVAICRDKRMTNLFFTEKNIDIPKQYDKTNYQFPVFIKPYDGSLSKDIYLINKENELTEFHLQNSKLMFMEYIDNSLYDEFTIDAYYDRKSELKCVVPRKRILVRSGEINKGLTCNNFLVDYVIKKLSVIEGAIGCLTIQVFFNEKIQRVVGIEINPRFGGGYPLSYFAGANYPKFLMEEYILGKEIAFFDKWEENLLMLRYDDEVLVSNYIP
jgi:carbamoyl-phosphate synthase large subunit